MLLIANLTLGDKHIDQRVDSLYATADPQFRRNMNVMFGPPLVQGNRTRALIERARAGVKVHLLFDALGSSKIDEDAVKAMKAAGIEVEKYNPWSSRASTTARTARSWSSTAASATPAAPASATSGSSGAIRSSASRARWRGRSRPPSSRTGSRSPAACCTARSISRESAGSEAAQFIVTSPGGGSESMQLMVLMSIAAAKRGVRIQLIVPGPATDSPLVRRASRSTWGDLLRAGVEFYEYQPTFFHCKVMVVDGLWVSVGSTNFDARSFSVNDEANLNVLDRDFAAEQARIFRAGPEALASHHARGVGKPSLDREALGVHPGALQLAALSGGVEKRVFLRRRFMKSG